MSVHINLWASPRNISTALMYSFAQRPDTRVYDEPLYGHYLNNSSERVLHPGEVEIINSMECNRNALMDLMTKDQESNVIFFKQMTHHLEELEKSFLLGMKNIILTRNPVDMIASYTKVIDDPSMKDLGYDSQLELFNYLEKHVERPAVIDAEKVLQNPKEQLKALCHTLGIPFHSQMLSWEAGPIPEDGIWAKHWYSNVHRSQGFIPFVKKEVKLNSRYDELLSNCQYCYDKLLEHAL